MTTTAMTTRTKTRTKTSTWTTVPIVVGTFALLLRVFVATHSYSGFQSPPEYGDYEAQRNWMSITRNLPTSQWYTASEDYWRLDYPPNSAYQSYLSGFIVGLFDPGLVLPSPEECRGREGVAGKLGMRLSVLVGDLCVYIPCCLLYWWMTALVGSGNESSSDNGFGKSNNSTLENTNVIFWLLVNPALILIDHGHFQYNSISLGLTVLAAGCVGVVSRFGGGERGSRSARRRPVPFLLFVAAFLYSMALNHKQMTLYYAPAFFVYMFALCCAAWRRDGVVAGLGMFVGLGVTVLGTFGVLWAPFGVEGAKDILMRIFPVQRGLYEDYVANFWCVSSLLYKWRVHWDKSTLARLCMVATLGASTPALALGARGVWKGKTQTNVFVLMLAGVSLSFFLFGFQVHEKSILMPLTAVLMLAESDGVDGVEGADGTQRMKTRMQAVAMMTMFPLLKKDGLTVAYWAMQLLVGVVGGWDWLVGCGLGLVHAVGAFVFVEGKPFLEDAVMMAAGFLWFAWVWVWVVWKLWREVEGVESLRGRLNWLGNVKVA